MNVGFHADDYNGGRAISQNDWANFGLSSVSTGTVVSVFSLCLNQSLFWVLAHEIMTFNGI
jgi:hypothetical protein